MRAWTGPGVAVQVGGRDKTPVSPHSIHSQDEFLEDDKGSSLSVPETQAGFATQAPVLSKQSSSTAYPISFMSNSISKSDLGCAKTSEETEPLVQDPKNAQLMSLLSQNHRTRKATTPNVQSLGSPNEVSSARNSTPIATTEEPLTRSEFLSSPQITKTAALSAASSSNGEAKVRLNLTPEQPGFASRQAKSQEIVEKHENQSCVAPDTASIKSDSHVDDVQPRSSNKNPKPPAVAEKSPKQTPINVNDPWKGVKRISRRSVRIPSNQRNLLEDESMLWFPPEPGAREPNRHIPLEILNSLTKLVERRSRRAKGLLASSTQPSSSTKPVSTPITQDTDCSEGSGEGDEDDGEMEQDGEESEGNDDDDEQKEEGIIEDKSKAKAEERGEEREGGQPRQDAMEGDGKQKAAEEDDPDDDDDLPWSQSPSPKRGEQLPPDSSPALLGHATSASLHNRTNLVSKSSSLAAPSTGPAPRRVSETHLVEDGSYSAERKVQGRAENAEPWWLTSTIGNPSRSSLTVSDKNNDYAPAQEDALIDPKVSPMEGVQGATSAKAKSDAESDVLGQRGPNESTSGSGPWTQPGQGTLEHEASNPSLDLVTINALISDSEESELECAVPHAYDDHFVEASLNTDSSLAFEPTSAQRSKSPAHDRKHTRTLAPTLGSRHLSATRESTGPTPQHSLAQSGLKGDSQDATASSRPVSDSKDDLSAQTDGMQDSDEVNSQEFYGQMQAEMEIDQSLSPSLTKKDSAGSNLMRDHVYSLYRSAESGLPVASDQSLLRRSSEGQRRTSAKRKDNSMSERIVSSKRVKLSDRSLSESLGMYSMELQDTHQIAGQKKQYSVSDIKASASLKFLATEDMTDSTKSSARKQPSPNIQHKALADAIQDHTMISQLHGVTTTVSTLSRVHENYTGANAAGGFTPVPGQENDPAWESDHMSIEDETIFSRFTAAYPDYPGTLVAFVKTCAYMEWLFQKGKMVHRSLWDDFIIRYLTEFPAWSDHRLSSGLENPVPYERFYDNEIEEPLHTKRILSPGNLAEALSLDPKSAGVMRYDFIPRLKEMKLNPVMQANGDHPGLIAAVKKKRASIGGTTANSRSSSSTPQRVLSLGGLNHPNHPNHLMRRASGPKDHIEEMESTLTPSKVPKSSQTAGRKDTPSHTEGSTAESSKEGTSPVVGHFFSTNDPPEATQARASNPDAARWNIKSSKGQRSPPISTRPTQTPSETTPTARRKEEDPNRVLSHSSDSLSIQSKDVLWPREAPAYPATHVQTPKTPKVPQRQDGSSHAALASPILGRTPPTPSLPQPRTASPILSPVPFLSGTTTADPSNQISQASAQRQTSQISSSVSVQESLPLPLPPLTGRSSLEIDDSQSSAAQHTSTQIHSGGLSKTQTTVSRLPRPPTSPPKSAYAPQKEAAHGSKGRKLAGPEPAAKPSKPVKQVKSATAATASPPRNEHMPTVSKVTSPPSAKAQAISTPPSKGLISSEVSSTNKPNLKVRQWLSSSPPVVRPVVHITTPHSIVSESLPTTGQRLQPARSDPRVSQATVHRSPIRSVSPELSQRRKRVEKSVESNPDEVLSRQQGAKVRAKRDAEPAQTQAQAQAQANAPESAPPVLTRSPRAPRVPDSVSAPGDPPTLVPAPAALEWWQEPHTPFKSFVAAYRSLKSVRADMGRLDAKAESKGGAGLLAEFLRESAGGEAGAGKGKGRVAWEEFCRGRGS